MQFMDVEHFDKALPLKVDRCFPVKGRIAPENLRSDDSAATADFATGFPRMGCTNVALMQTRIWNGINLVRSEILPVTRSAFARIARERLPAIRRERSKTREARKRLWQV